MQAHDNTNDLSCIFSDANSSYINDRNCLRR